MMATVKHGRRKGASREIAPSVPSVCVDEWVGVAYDNGWFPGTPDLPQLNINGTGHETINLPPVQPPPVDLRQVTVLTNTDWDRIQTQLNRRKIEADRLRQAREEKEKLHELSKNQIKNWANTISGQRQKKLEARKIREAKEEEERKLVDIEEAKFQAQKRKDAIEKAKTQQYYQTDRVKGFHGALLLTEVLKEREAQVELKKLKGTLSAGKDQEWLVKAQKDYEEGILRDQGQAVKRMQKLHQTADFQKAQIRVHLKEMEKEKVEDQVEGEELKRLAAQYELEKKRLEVIRLKEAKTLMSDNRKQIEEVNKIRNIQQQQEEEEDDECRIFAAAKRKMMKLRAEKERQLHQEKQERLEKIREKLDAQMQQKMDDEDERIKRAQEEGEAKRIKEDAEKEAWTKKMQAEMSEHRSNHMQENERKIAVEKQRELEMLVVRKAADEQFAQNEEEKSLRRKEDLKKLQNFHIKQLDERRVVDERENQESLALDQKNLELLGLEESQFQEYAQKVIEHCEKGGRNVYPLQQAAKEGAGGGHGPVFTGKGGIRPSYMVADQSGVQMPNYQRGTTDETKQAIYGNGQTHKRLGFVW